MTSLLAIAGRPEHDDELVAEISAHAPDVVLIAIDGGGPETWATGESAADRALRDRIARLLEAIAARTGAAVSGTVVRPWALARGRYDAVLDRAALAVR